MAILLTLLAWRAVFPCCIGFSSGLLASHPIRLNTFQRGEVGVEAINFEAGGVS